MGEGKSGLESLCVVAGKREEKGKINVFDVIGDWIQLQKYKCQLLHFSREIFRAQRGLMASGGSELEECCVRASDLGFAQQSLGNCLLISSA